MFIRDNSRFSRTKGPMAKSAKTPYVAAIKRGRGPYTMSNPVYSGGPAQQPAGMSGGEGNGNSNGNGIGIGNGPDGQLKSHTFNINVKALKNNHKYYQRVVPAPANPLPQTKSHVVMNEQRELYKQHRDRMANIKGKVNTHLPPPKVKVEGNHMELSYMEMLTALYRKSNNTLRTFTKSPERLAGGRWRNANVAREKERKQQEQNKQFHKGGELFDPHVGKSRRQKAGPKVFSYEIPLHVLHRYENLMNQCDIGVLCKLLRPQVYFDLEVRGTRIQGRLSIQLFTEACPEVVLQFVRICTSRANRHICFTRTFAPIWLEGKIALDPHRTLELNHIEHDFEVLNHGVDAGILSFPSRYVRGNMNKALNFTISFKPLSILNGKRIAFGKVRKGLALLERIHDATAHVSKPHDLVILSGCGLL